MMLEQYKDYLVRNSKDSKESVGNVIEGVPVSPWSFVMICLGGVLMAMPSARTIAEQKQ